MSLVLPCAFFATALLYASVGFGGGSTYSALLVLSGADYRLIPLLSLSCNIIVVSGGVWHFSRNGHLQMRRIAPWLLFSIPASFIGGAIPIPEMYFVGLLGCVLFFSGVRLLWPEKKRDEEGNAAPVFANRPFMTPLFGSGLGLLAGITGIGGGIFLAPLFYFLKWGQAKQIAAACSVFILANSLAGMTGQLFKLGNIGALALALPYWVLLPAVLCGGQIGSWLGSSRINARIVKKMTAVLILYVAVRLIRKFILMI